MKQYKSIKNIVLGELCTGCGICEDVCPQNAININLTKDLYLPCINYGKCNNCSRCYNICTGIGINLHKKSAQIFYGSFINFDYYIGYFINCYAGFSNNYDIRYHSASGGVLTQFLIYLLKKEIIQGAVVTRFNNNLLLLPETFIATTEKDILSAKSSKYCPVSHNGIINKIKKLNGKYIIVGLPCHIHSYRNYEEIDSEFKNKILGYFSIYCSSNRTFKATEYILKHYKINKNELKFFSYRDDGCLGYLKAVSYKNNIVKIPYKEYYHMLRSFFKPKRCLFCVDHYGYLADMNFGDIQTGKYKSDTIGINSIITRKHYFDKLLIQAQNEGFISLELINSSIINKSQETMLVHKRKIASLNMKIEHLLGKRTPEYDLWVPDTYSFKNYITYISIKIQRLIGKYKVLWPIIDLMNFIKRPR